MSTLPNGSKFNLLQKIRYARDPIGFMTACRDRYGDPFMIRTMVGTVIITGNPDLARQFFFGSHEQFVVSTTQMLIPLLCQHSLILEKGNTHFKIRKLLTPHFYGTSLADYANRIQSFTRRQLSQVLDLSSVVMQDHTRIISLNIIIETVFGVTDNARKLQMARAN